MARRTEVNPADAEKVIHIVCVEIVSTTSPFGQRSCRSPRGGTSCRTSCAIFGFMPWSGASPKGTGLEPARGASAPTPSAAWFVFRALKRKGFRVSEREVNRIYWNPNGLAGALEDSMPQPLGAV